MFEGGQISEGGDKFPRKFGPGGTNFPGNLARGGQIFGGDIFPVTPAFARNVDVLVIYFQVQWNPVNTTTVRPEYFGRISGTKKSGRNNEVVY